MNNKIVIVLFILFGVVVLISSLQTVVKSHGITKVTKNQTASFQSQIHNSSPTNKPGSVGTSRRRVRIHRSSREGADE